MGCQPELGDNSRALIILSMTLVVDSKVRKRVKIRNRYNHAPHLTKDTSGESDNFTIKHHKREPRGQSFPSRRPKQTRTKV